MTARIKRDRVPFTCPNCTAKVWSRPDNRLICGQCFIPMEPQLPAYYPQAQESARPNRMKVGITEIPLEDFAIPGHLRDLLNRIHEETPAPAPAVVRQPELQETEQPTEPKRKRALSEELLAKVDRAIEAGLRCEKEGGSKRSGWKKNLAESIGRDPAFISNRIKRFHSQSQAVAA